MDNQNQGGYNPQNLPPEQPNPYTNTPNVNPQSPFSAPQVSYQPQPLPGQRPPKDDDYDKKKKLIIIGSLVGLFVILSGLIIALVFSGAKKESGDTNQLTRSYDSPIGLLPTLQAAEIKNGSYKMTSSYATGTEASREGVFFAEDSLVDFEILPETAATNEFIKSLYVKQSKQADYAEKTQGATRNFKYDFMSFMGYGYLIDVNLPNGFIPVVEAARDNSELAEANKALRLGRDCNAALSELKSKIGRNMTTTQLDFDITEDGIRKRAEVSFASRQSIDNSVIRFLENCFDQSNKEAEFYKKFTDNLRQNVTTSPVFSYWVENGKNYLEVSRLPDSIALNESVKFELSELNDVQTAKVGETASYTERRNQFGLAYSICRVPPVTITTIKEGYRFTPEDTLYQYPNSSHTGYYCDTRSVPAEFAPAKNITLKLGNGLTTKVEADKIQAVRALHDLNYEIEKYHQENDRYPNASELTELASNNMNDLSQASQGLLNQRTIRYRPSPDQCVGDCSQYELAYNHAAGFRLVRSSD